MIPHPPCVSLGGNLHTIAAFTLFMGDYETPIA